MEESEIVPGNLGDVSAMFIDDDLCLCYSIELN